MTAIRKTTLQVAYFQGFTNLATDLCTSNDRFGFNQDANPIQNFYFPIDYPSYTLRISSFYLPTTFLREFGIRNSILLYLENDYSE